VPFAGSYVPLIGWVVVTGIYNALLGILSALIGGLVVSGCIVPFSGSEMPVGNQLAVALG
jgi:hypothetical protein